MLRFRSTHSRQCYRLFYPSYKLEYTVLPLVSHEGDHYRFLSLSLATCSPLNLNSSSFYSAGKPKGQGIGN